MSNDLVQDNDILISGNEGSNQLVGQAALSTPDITVSAPAPGQTIEHSLEPGQTATLNFDAATATPGVDGNNFVLTFDSNGDGEGDSRIVFLDLVEQSQGDDTPILVIGGVELSANLLIGQAQALAEGETLETAAGPGPAGGGGSTYSDDLGSAIDLLNAQGVIDPTELQFGLLGGIDEITDPAQGTFRISFITTDVEGPVGGISGTFAGGFEDALPNQHLVQGDIGFDDDPFTSGEIYAAPMQVQFDFTASDNETLDSVEINALPPGVELYIGGFSPANLYAGGFPVTITPENYDSVFIRPPEDSDEDIPVSGQANISDPDSGESASLPFSAEAIVDAVADVPLIGIGRDISDDLLSFVSQDHTRDESTDQHVLLSRSGNGSISEESTICVPLNAALKDVDGSEVLSLEISGVPSDFTLLDGFLPAGWVAVGGEPVDGLVTYTISYTAGDPLPTSINGVIAFDTNDYTTENSTNPDTGRDVEGDVNAGEPVNLTVTAIATEQETDIGTDELTLENNEARASETFTFDITEDVPDIDSVSLILDETTRDGLDSVDEKDLSVAVGLVGTPDVTGLPDGVTLLLPEAIGVAQKDLSYSFKSDGSDDEIDGSDGVTQDPGLPSGQSTGVDGRENIAFNIINGQDSGLLATDPATGVGQVIKLYYDANDNIVWGITDSGVVAFSAVITDNGNLTSSTVPHTGSITFVQYAAIHHPDSDPLSHDEDVKDGPDLSLTYTITDDEGDSSEGTFTIEIEDDGPIITTTGPQEFVLNGSFEDGHTLSGSSYGTFNSLSDGSWDNGGAGQPKFEIQHGSIAGPAQHGDALLELDAHENSVAQQDIAGMTTGEDYVLTFYYQPRVNDGTDTDDIIVKWNGVVVEDLTSTDAPGGWKQFTVTVTASAGTNNLSFEGGGSSESRGGYIDNISINQALIVDETDLNVDDTLDFSGRFTIDFGSDGQGAPTTYDTSTIDDTDSGLIDTASGQAILLYNDGAGGVAGRVGGMGGDDAFTVTVDANGVVKLDQIQAVEHADPDNHDDVIGIPAGKIQLTATVTDGDGDTANSSIDLGTALYFKDDGPTANDDTAEVSSPVTSTPQNIGFVIDVSGSIDDSEYATLLNGVRSFISDLVSKGDPSDFAFSFSSFGSSGRSHGTFMYDGDGGVDGIGLNDFVLVGDTDTNPKNLDTLLQDNSSGISNINGLTNLNAGLRSLFTSGDSNTIDNDKFLDNGITDAGGHQNRIIFIGDGDINGGNLTIDANNSDPISTNTVIVTAVGIGGGVTPADFEAFFGESIVKAEDVLSSASFSDLAQTLIESFTGNFVATGTLIANDSTGADGATITALSIDGAPAAVEDVSTGVWTITKPAEYTFTYNPTTDKFIVVFEDGAETNLNIDYILTDGDSDTSSGVATVVYG